MREVLSARSIVAPGLAEPPAFIVNVSRRAQADELQRTGFDLIEKIHRTVDATSAAPAGRERTDTSRFNSSQVSIVIWSRTMRAFSRAWQTEETMEFGLSWAEHHEFRDRSGGRALMAGCERILVAGSLNDRQPVFAHLRIVHAAKIQQQLEIYIQDARDVFRALDVARHPVERVGDAG